MAPRPSRLVLVLALAMGCGAAAPTAALRTMPELAEERDATLDALGRALWEALGRGSPWDILFADDHLHALLRPDEATRFAVRRSDAPARLRTAAARVPEAIDGTSYLGICAQDSRDEPPGGPTGLVASAWVISRVLVAGRIGGSSRRIALWIDGTFVASEEGLRAVDLERIETPRWEHSDLEILSCDISEGL